MKSKTLTWINLLGLFLLVALAVIWIIDLAQSHQTLVALVSRVTNLS